MKVIPVYREDSFPLGGCMYLNPSAVAFIEKHKDLLYVPIYNDEGKLISIRAVKEDLCSYDNCHR